jgi:hypothetical protein
LGLKRIYLQEKSVNCDSQGFLRPSRISADNMDSFFNYGAFLAEKQSGSLLGKQAGREMWLRTAREIKHN